MNVKFLNTHWLHSRQNDWFPAVLPIPVAVGEGSVPGERGMRHWVRRTNLVDSRTSVTDIKFAPKSLGLLLATCSADGVMRIYEAPDVMNLSQWTLQHEVSCKLPCSCLSWNPSFSRSKWLFYWSNQVIYRISYIFFGNLEVWCL